VLQAPSLGCGETLQRRQAQPALAPADPARQWSSPEVGGARRWGSRARDDDARPLPLPSFFFPGELCSLPSFFSR
jgi:hypothetical protein